MGIKLSSELRDREYWLYVCVEWYVFVLNNFMDCMYIVWSFFYYIIIRYVDYFYLGVFAKWSYSIVF